MNVMTVVMAHPDAAETYARNRHLWEHHRTPVLTYTTADPHHIRFPREVLAFGHAEHHGPASLDRFRYLMRSLSNIAEERGIEYFLINEYDSFCLSPVLPPMLFADCIWGNLHHEQPGTRFISTTFLIPPLFASARIIKRIADGCDKHRDVECEGFWDRWLGYVCEQEEIPMMPFGPMGFAVNTIGDAELPSAIEAVKLGASMIHGVKSENVLLALENACSL